MESDLIKLTSLEKKTIGIIQGYEKLSPAKAREIIFNNSEIKSKRTITKLCKMGFLNFNGLMLEYTGKEIY